MTASRVFLHALKPPTGDGHRKLQIQILFTKLVLKHHLLSGDLLNLMRYILQPLMLLLLPRLVQCKPSDIATQEYVAYFPDGMSGMEQLEKDKYSCSSAGSRCNELSQSDSPQVYVWNCRLLPVQSRC